MGWRSEDRRKVGRMRRLRREKKLEKSGVREVFKKNGVLPLTPIGTLLLLVRIPQSI